MPVVNVSNCPSCLQNLGHPSLSLAVTPCRSTSRGAAERAELVTDEASLSSRRPRWHGEERCTGLRAFVRVYACVHTDEAPTASHSFRGQVELICSAIGNERVLFYRHNKPGHA